MAPQKKQSTKKSPSTKTKKSTKKNSLVGNINKKKRTGKSRSKSTSTVSDEAYGEMKKGWPKSHRPKTSKGRKQTRNKR